MADADHDGYSSEEEEEEEAFLDLSDPNNVIVDDGENRDVPEELSDGEADDAGETDEARPKVEFSEKSIASFRSLKPLHCIATDSSGRKIATGSEDDNVFLCSYDGTLSSVQQLSGHSDTVTHVAFSPNDEMVASGGMDGSVILWKASDGSQIARLKDLNGEIEALLWHPSSLILVAGGTDCLSAMWNATKGALIQHFVGHRDAVSALAWTSDVKKLISASADSSVMVFNPKSGDVEITITKEIPASITALHVVSQDKVIVGCADGGIAVLSLSGGRVVATHPELHSQAIESFATAKSQQFFAACSCDAKVSVWNTGDCTLRTVLQSSDGVIRIRWVDHWIVAGCMDGALRLWDGRQAVPEPVEELVGHEGPILDICTLGGQTVASVSDDCSLKVFQLSKLTSV
jgi:WD40 repeat protein